MAKPEMRVIDDKLDELRAKKTTTVNRDDIIFLLELMRDIQVNVQTLIDTIAEGMTKIIDSAKIPHPAATISNDNIDTANADDSDTPEYTCFNCGDVNDKALPFCRNCNAGLKWAK
jgi:hypothetical protein